MLAFKMLVSWAKYLYRLFPSRRKFRVPLALFMFADLCFMIYLLCHLEHLHSPVKEAPLPLHPAYRQLLNSTPEMFVLEPRLLKQAYIRGGDKWEELRWRFDLPEEYEWNESVLTVGVFGSDVDDEDDWLDEFRLNSSSCFSETGRVTGFGQDKTWSNPFGTTETATLHIFYECAEFRLHLHIVALYRVEHALWIGEIPRSTPLPIDLLANGLAYGRTEQIFDPFWVEQFPGEVGIRMPNDLEHFISQIPTSRYLHCPPVRGEHWMRKNKLTEDKAQLDLNRSAFARFKRMMRELRMQFWMVSGTLLGWHRQCSIIPYTVDTDFSSWSKYFAHPSVNYYEVYEQLLDRVKGNGLFLTMERGEYRTCKEFTFNTIPLPWQVDMFLNYPNATHHRMPLHLTEGTFHYMVYRKYELCSALLLGYKLLAPCTPTEVVVEEYGLDWEDPREDWNYAVSTVNFERRMPVPPHEPEPTQVWRRRSAK